MSLGQDWWQRASRQGGYRTLTIALATLFVVFGSEVAETAFAAFVIVAPAAAWTRIVKKVAPIRKENYQLYSTSVLASLKETFVVL